MNCSKILLAVALAFAPMASAQVVTLGSVTQLPLPRYMSLKGGKANVRRGPSTANQIDWVYRHRGTPLVVLAEYLDWRKVRDVDNEGGWVYAPLLSDRRTVLVTEDSVFLRESAQQFAAPIAELEAGVIMVLGSCLPEWCAVSVEGVEGWVARSGIWGVAADEIIN